MYESKCGISNVKKRSSAFAPVEDTFALFSNTEKIRLDCIMALATPANTARILDQRLMIEASMVTNMR